VVVRKRPGSCIRQRYQPALARAKLWAHADPRGGVGLFGRAAVAVTHDRTNPRHHFAVSPLACDQTKPPSPHIVLVKRRITRTDTPLERQEEVRTLEDLDVCPTDDPIATGPKLGVATHPARRRGAFADERCTNDVRGGLRVRAAWIERERQDPADQADRHAQNHQQ
jgi:hypothetical protein